MNIDDLAYSANENVWNVLSQLWSVLPRSVEGRSTIFMSDAMSILVNLDSGLSELGMANRRSTADAMRKSLEDQVNDIIPTEDGALICFAREGEHCFWQWAIHNLAK